MDLLTYSSSKKIQEICGFHSGSLNVAAHNSVVLLEYSCLVSSMFSQIIKVVLALQEQESQHRSWFRRSVVWTSSLEGASYRDKTQPICQKLGLLVYSDTVDSYKSFYLKLTGKGGFYHRPILLHHRKTSVISLLISGHKILNHLSPSKEFTFIPIWILYIPTSWGSLFCERHQSLLLWHQTTEKVRYMLRLNNDPLLNSHKP